MTEGRNGSGRFAENLRTWSDTRTPSTTDIRHFASRVLCLVIVLLCLPSVVKAQADAIPTVDAPLPQGAIIHWGDEPVDKQSEKRSRIVLNGLWRFMPATGDAVAAPPKAGWGWARVPGSWRSSPFPIVHHAVVAQGTGPAWREFGTQPEDRSTRAWYSRPIHIPKSWDGGRILLDLAWVGTDASVLIDGKRIGTIRWPHGSVDVTDHVTVGAEHRLDLLVVAVPEEGMVARYMDAQDVAEVQARVLAPGLTGDVSLRLVPSGARIGDVFIKTSTRQKRLDLDLLISGLVAEADVEVEAQILNADDQQVAHFRQRVRSRGDEQQTIRVGWAWDNARPWSPQDPHLYTLRLTVRGPGLHDQIVQRFGFREFWIEGRDFYLNGTLIRLRPTVISAQQRTPAEFAGFLDGAQALGFNFVEIWPRDPLLRGSLPIESELMRLADERGMMISGLAPALQTEIGRRGEAWKGDQSVARIRQRAIDLMTPYRNHPSIVMWGTTGNFFAHAQDQWPVHIGRRDWTEHDAAWRARAEPGRAAIQAIREVDPTRPIFTHHGTSVGDVYTANHYLNLIPLQEREEWMSDWAKHGEMPYMAVEFGTPLNTTFRRARNGHNNADRSEPLMTEFAAGEIGEHAYRMESDRYRRGIVSAHRQDQLWTFRKPDFDAEPAYQQLQERYLTNTWRAWRTWGLSGGMIPWSNGFLWQQESSAIDQPPFVPGQLGFHRDRISASDLHPLSERGGSLLPAAKALRAVNRKTLAYIAGGPDAFTDKTHHYRVGSTLDKQVVLINDTEGPLTYEAKVVVRLDQPVLDTKLSGELKPGEIRLVPVKIELPASDLKADTRQGQIELGVTIGDERHDDRFQFTVFPPEAPARLEVAVFDPVGQTAKMLEGMGIATREWANDDTSMPLIIGREVLSRGHELPHNLADWLERGGRAMIMPQHPDWLEQMGFRPARHQARQVFAVSADHPILRGLTDANLRDWSGSGTLLDPYPDYGSKEGWTAGPYGFPKWGWRWGNRHTVSSVSIEKPHHSGWRPIMHSQFDLAYTPLMELDRGRGRLLWCQLDLEDQTSADPAAERLARNLLRYLSMPNDHLESRTASYLGGEAGEGMLKQLGVLYERSNKTDTNPLLIVGQEVEVGTEELKSWLGSGRRVLFLPRKTGQVGPWTLVSDEAHSGATQVPDWPEARGLSASDLRTRTPVTTVVAEGEGVVAEGLLARWSHANGVALLVQVNPGPNDAAVQPYLRYTRWRQTRTLSQVIANLGGRFKADDALLSALQKPRQRKPLAGDWSVTWTHRLPPAAALEERHADPGISELARQIIMDPEVDAEWAKLPERGMWDELGPAWSKHDGEVVARRWIDLPESWRSEELVVSLGVIDDYDTVYFNGVKIGSMDAQTRGPYMTPRVYRVPAEHVRAGRNRIDIRIWDDFGGGGLAGDVGDRHLMRARDVFRIDYYHPDYRDDFDYGDDPFRYYRW